MESLGEKPKRETQAENSQRSTTNAPTFRIGFLLSAWVESLGEKPKRETQAENSQRSTTNAPPNIKRQTTNSPGAQPRRALAELSYQFHFSSLH
ncbi:hypothetical protein QS306_15135 [Paraburkholderia bonniea]|uniref:hypothetical protein n=1 Tax=Paraburkholderia bonniea TaxID=2152891 RepID=UPI0025722AF0|nr:hypothetical protein [Paraburkholderia bonniea]WJF92093.1 hypothetical protein QS306_15135 [Paraburkholderia bonniea]WJF95413.1 hypothetical protein QS308_15140 [Paraburkholderia bonniea]